MTKDDLDEVRSRIDQKYACVMGTESYERAMLVEEIDRLNQSLRWEQDRTTHIGTHGPGCWSWGYRHYNCLTDEFQKLESRNKALVDLMRSYLDGNSTWQIRLALRALLEEEA